MPTRDDDAAGYDPTDSPLGPLHNVTVMAMHRLLGGHLTDILGEESTERFPTEPPNYSALKFVKTWGNPDKPYTYVALRVGDMWYLSGQRIKTMDWPKLREFIHDNPCEIATAWVPIPVPEPSPVEELTPAEWHRINYGQAIDGAGTNGTDQT